MGGGGMQTVPQTQSSSTSYEIPHWQKMMGEQTAYIIHQNQYANPIHHYFNDQYGDKRQQIADLSNLEQWAINRVPGIADTPQGSQQASMYAGLAPLAAGRFASNQDMYNDFAQSPYMQAAQGAFNQGVAPQIQNQMALSGLGRSSSLANALSLGWSQMLPTALSQYSTQYVEPQMQRQQQALQSQAGMLGSMVSPLMSLGQQSTERELAAVNAAFQGGGLDRGIQQAKHDAEYADMLRKQALMEQLTFGPLGAMPSSYGARTASVGSTAVPKQGGLFK